MTKKTEKRNFAVDTSNLDTEVPILESALYAGVVVDSTITGKENSQNIGITKERKWNKEKAAMVETGKYVISGWISYNAVLTSRKAIKALQRDEPKLFNGMIPLNFDKEKHTLLKENPALGAWLVALGLKDTDFHSAVEWDYDENVEVPEDLAEVENVVDMINSVNYHRALFTLICQAANDNIPVAVKVIKQPHYQNKEVMTNVIDRGTSSAPFCGIMKYTEGFDSSLPDEE